MVIGDKIVLRDPNAGRWENESSFASVGKVLLESISVHNETVSDEKYKIEPPTCSARALSYSIMQSTRGKISKSRMKVYLGRKTWWEISNTMKQQPFDEELEKIYESMEQPNAQVILILAEGHWASRLAVKNCLYNAKKQNLAAKDKSKVSSRTEKTTRKSLKAKNSSTLERAKRTTNGVLLRTIVDETQTGSSALRKYARGNERNKENFQNLKRVFQAREEESCFEDSEIDDRDGDESLGELSFEGRGRRKLEKGVTSGSEEEEGRTREEEHLSYAEGSREDRPDEIIPNRRFAVNQVKNVGKNKRSDGTGIKSAPLPRKRGCTVSKGLVSNAKRIRVHNQDKILKTKVKTSTPKQRR